MGFYGKNTYMAETWNRLDFVIVIAGLVFIKRNNYISTNSILLKFFKENLDQIYGENFEFHPRKFTKFQDKSRHHWIEIFSSKSNKNSVNN